MLKNFAKMLKNLLKKRIPKWFKKEQLQRNEAHPEFQSALVKAKQNQICPSWELKGEWE